MDALKLAAHATFWVKVIPKHESRRAPAATGTVVFIRIAFADCLYLLSKTIFRDSKSASL